ncbi:M23 family metallopeptidase [Nocardia yamanashiensis]|uniref:M23 family metallopeptidase n=1 Tax=Nocardia yamanashiensis TaxID=209247 RepID=UPI00082F01E0|nr:M23 family metallopeptidase [Nocardia yamanashiensis]UGT43980.1 M23 family metallopeptidase [Nocardia yamanashiensis]
MPVTVPLSLSRKAGKYRTAATRAVAVSAVVASSLGVLAAADPSAAGEPVSDQVANTATTVAAPLAFTPVEAQMPQIVPQEVLDFLNNLHVEQARPKTVRPVAGPLTSGFGQRWGAAHNGIDFGDGFGAPIRAVTDGTVIEAGPASGFGLWVRVQQDDGTIGVYGHMQDILVQVGQQVRAGDEIATVGSRGYSTGPHLHYEVHTAPGAPVDPIPWLAGRGMDVGAPVD